MMTFQNIAQQYVLQARQ